MKTITKGVLITLLVLFIYHVTSDRVTPYTSQSNIEVLLVQIAPQVTGQVIEVATHDNERVKKGQLLYRIDPEPFEIALRVGGSQPRGRAAEPAGLGLPRCVLPKPHSPSSAPNSRRARSSAASSST